MSTTLAMSDEGEESDGGEKERRSASPSPSLCLPRGSPSCRRPLDLFSSSSPLLEDTDPPYLASPDCLHSSPEDRDLAQATHPTPPKFRNHSGDSTRLYAHLDVLCEQKDEPLPPWKGLGPGNDADLQHRGQRTQRVPQPPDFGNHHANEHTSTDSDSR